jgi:hypothetical protein
MQRDAKNFPAMTNVRCAAPSGLSLDSLFGNPESSMQDSSRETEVMTGRVPYTVVRFERLLDQMGGNCGIELSQDSESSRRSAVERLSREDAAVVIAKALTHPPGPGKGRVFIAGATADGVAPSNEEWEFKFVHLDKSALSTAPKSA